MQLVRIGAALLLQLLAVGIVFADGHLPCETASVGDSEQNILEKCGEPSFIEGDAWTYDRGGVEKRYRVLNFENGKVAAIEDKERQ